VHSFCETKKLFSTSEKGKGTVFPLLVSLIFFLKEDPLWTGCI
jgi:hypothetical protein